MKNGSGIISLSLLTLQPINGTVASPAYRISHGSCDHATWSFSMHTTMHAGGPSDIPVSPGQTSQADARGPRNGRSQIPCAIPPEVAGNGPVDRPQSLSSSPSRS